MFHSREILLGLAVVMAVASGCSNVPSSVVGAAALAAVAPQAPAAAGTRQEPRACPPIALPAESNLRTELPASRSEQPAVASEQVAVSDAAVQETMSQLAQAEGLDQPTRKRIAEELCHVDPATRLALVQCFLTGKACQEPYARHDESKFIRPAASDALTRQTSAPAEVLLAHNVPGAVAARSANPVTRPADALLASASQKVPPQGPRSTDDPSSEPWRKHLAESIACLEAELHGAAATDSELPARLRLLYLAAGRSDEAIRPMPASPPCVQDFWRHELLGLSLWLDAKRLPDTAGRAGEAKERITAAATSLGMLAPLAIHNLTFVTEVQSYGVVKPFAHYEFAAEQEVLLYAEIENFSAEETSRGFHTAMRGRYRILDAQGQSLDARDLGTTEERCRNFRRDFFLAYHLRLPKQIRPGKHTLELEVEDLKSRKTTRSVAEFSIKAAR